MKNELADKLKAAYPALFAPPQDAQIWCRDGWLEILGILCEYLTIEIEAGEPPLHFQEIKQKFGRLTIHARGGSESTRALVLAAEAASLFVCEECGQPGRLMRPCGIQVLCASCCPAGAVPAGPDVFHAVLNPLRARWGRLST